MNVPREHKIIAVVEFVTAAGLFLSWILFYIIGDAPENTLRYHLGHKHAFPMPDLILGTTLVVAGHSILKGKGIGRTLSLVCAGCLIFLGIIDYDFGFRNRIYTVSMVDILSNGFVNLWCIVFGLYVLLKLKGSQKT
ncbi:MAG: hypothetical protein GY866_18295 [Proteobacteria bacterium]|nr:hypothetical protein [Pseudomonadota bacterium]